MNDSAFRHAAYDGNSKLYGIGKDEQPFGGTGNYLIGGAGNAVNDADYVNSFERKLA